MLINLEWWEQTECLWEVTAQVLNYVYISESFTASQARRLKQLTLRDLAPWTHLNWSCSTLRKRYALQSPTSLCTI